MTLALRMPLRGSRLIEASAGTGKTFTIALVYVRLVLDDIARQAGVVGGVTNAPERGSINAERAPQNATDSDPESATAARSNDVTAGSADSETTPFDRPLLPPDILVVTFTEAAAAELKSRIRERLVEAAEVFRAGADEGADESAAHGDDAKAGPHTEANPRPSARPQHDKLLVELRGAFPSEFWAACARQLTLAAEWMDEAAVSTIHAWALRMLQEHAFDSGSLFQQTLVPDQSEQLRDAVRDYWRTTFGTLGGAHARLIRSLFTDGPDALEQRLRLPLRRGDAQLTWKGTPISGDGARQAIDKAAVGEQRVVDLQAQARSLYRTHRDDVRAALAEVRPKLNGNSFRGKDQDVVFDSWLDELDDWGNRDAEASDFVGKLRAGRIKLNKGANEGAVNGAFFVAVDAWQAAVEEAEGTSRETLGLILADAVHRVRERLDQQLDERAELGFDDLLNRLDRALAGPRGEALARRIRNRYPVAMIDEFQDTDPVQYRIFDQIHEVAKNHGDAAITLIGDPKQAIYSFRGADIDTYLQAKRACGGREDNLDTNFRSTAEMVAAVNQLFAHAEKNNPRGAFRFREETPPDDADDADDAEDTLGTSPKIAQPATNDSIEALAEQQDASDAGSASHDQRTVATAAGNPIPFRPVHANGRSERLELRGRVVSGLTAWSLLLGDVLGTDRHLALMAAHGAEQIARWLNHEGSGFRDGARFQPLRPGDIAILVRNRTEANAMRSALRARDLDSVYLSDRDSVFESAEAHDLLRWLRACAEPEDDRLLREALSTRTLGLSLATLQQLQQDELAWEQQQTRFAGYHQQWQRFGVLPTLRRLLQDYDVPARLLTDELGERRLTDLLHLMEWAQETSASVDGEAALIHRLAEQVAEPQGDQDVIRLESDAELIQIVTIYKSKGLEYPIVLLPFASNWRDVTGRQKEVLIHSDGGVQIELAGKDACGAAWTQADDERLSEEVRLLYVALTRARHATFLGVAPLAPGNAKSPKIHKGALGWLLAGGTEFANEFAVRACLDDLRAGGMPLEIDEVDIDPDRTRYRPSAAPRIARPPRKPVHAPFPNWWIASYSALTRAATTLPEDSQAETLRDANRDEAPLGLEDGTLETAAGEVMTAGGAGSFAGGAPIEAGPEGAALIESEPDPEPGKATAGGGEPTTAAESTGSGDLFANGDLFAGEREGAPPDGERAAPAGTAGSTPAADDPGSARAALRHADAGADSDPAARADADAGSTNHGATSGVGRAADSSTTAVVARSSLPATPPSRAAPGTIHAFPRGPEPGTFLHGLIEWAGARGFASIRDGGKGEAACAEEITRRCRVRGWERHAPVVKAWLGALVDAPFPLQHAAPMQLTALSRHRVEQEFWFAVHEADVAALDALVTATILPGAPRAAIAPTQLDGLLTGFIDLVAEHDGHFYVIDWKSNYLGPDASAYTRAAMEQALLAKRYDIQLSLYLLALHRHLRQRLRDYDYDRHVGGALFVFLRGLDAETHGMLDQLPPRAFVESLDALVSSKAASGAAA